jgi:type VI secretion system protein ImpL
VRNTLRRICLSRWFRTFLVCAILAALVWFLGPLLGLGSLHPLETDIARWITIGAIFILWLIYNLIQELRDRHKEKELADAVTAPPPPDPAEVASAEEVALLSDRLREALHTLRHAKIAGGSRRRLAALPWYMFIGPPGAGKTTALLNCGLKFPLAEAPANAKAIRGVGGTRNCEWWFTDEAVLIDTAGRYTTQDSQAEVDSKAWLGFLRLLKKHRRRRPLNGVLVAISLSDLSQLGEDERLDHARKIRRRVRELQDELGVRIPVYVLFTKADLIPGFVEFFDNMGREEREQVWGATFPLDTGRDEAGAVAGFPDTFDALLTRLNDRMLERVHQEPDLQRRRLVYGFPQQLTTLRDVAAEFLTECFRPSRLEARALLRGVYFTSGTQEGAPIDRLIGAISAEFGLPRLAVSAYRGSGRSYFLARLIKEVIFGEAALVGLDPKVERRARMMGYAGYAVSALVLLACAGAWLASYIGNRDLIAEVHARSGVYTDQVAELRKRGASDADLTAVVPALNTLRGIRSGYNDRDASIPVSLTFGLYQGGKLGSAAQEAYARALNGLLLPRLIARLEVQIALRMNDTYFLYQALKVYLILGSRGPLDRELVTTWYTADLLATFPSDDETATRDALNGHIDAMMQQPLTKLALNEDLITRARDVLKQQPPADYSYNRIMRSKRVQSLPVWAIADNAGPGAGRVLDPGPHKTLDDGVPGIYTWPGYHSVFLLMLPTVAQDLAEDSWVLGRPKRDVTGELRDASKLRRDVLGLYLDDYVRIWDKLIKDISIKKFTNQTEEQDTLSLLSAPASPLRDLLTAIDAQTQLSRPAATDQAMAATEARAAKFGQRAAGFAAFEARSGLTLRQNEGLNIASELFGIDPSGKASDPTKRVDDAFRPFHDFVVPPQGQQSGLETMLQKIQQMYQASSQPANLPIPGSPTGGSSSATAQLRDSARTMPAGVAAMATGLAANADGVAGGDLTKIMQDAWNSTVLPACAPFNRYPMVATSSADVPVDDFARLLAPGGAMDKFFNQYLSGSVDTTQKPWKWRSQVPLGVSPGSLSAFELAAQIREALFAGGNQIQVRFDLMPVTMDPQVGQIIIDVAGQATTWSHGPPEDTRFQWPGQGGKSLVRITMSPSTGGPGQITERDGPWALLRLLEAEHLTPTGQPDKFKVIFTGGGGTATYELNASSVNNPFTLAMLRSFNCPPKL